jgi:hypothetical protein
MRGKIAPVVPWPKDLFVFDPAPIFESVDRLTKKGGREAVGRCTTKDDAEQASEWLLARLARLSPTTKFSTEITPGAGQFLLKLARS